MKPKVIVELLKETVYEWQEDKASRLAAALAYYTAFSIARLIINCDRDRGCSDGVGSAEAGYCAGFSASVYT